VKLGVLGGTFDPPHIGHLIAAQEAWRLLGLDRVIFVPAREPPHKRDRPVTPPALRLEMCRAATAGDDRFDVSELELERGGPSYSADTLAALRASHPGSVLYFLLGADQIRELHTWHRPEAVAALARLVAVGRGGDELAEPSIAVPYERITVPRIDVSSSEVRRRVGAGEPIRYLVPAGVEAVIRRAGVYG
jgi:nicotinate-nucleotide adenylyltransferase